VPRPHAMRLKSSQGKAEQRLSAEINRFNRHQKSDREDAGMVLKRARENTKNQATNARCRANFRLHEETLFLLAFVSLLTTVAGPQKSVLKSVRWPMIAQTV
jgi:hypothetical protein